MMVLNRGLRLKQMLFSLACSSHLASIVNASVLILHVVSILSGVLPSSCLL